MYRYIHYTYLRNYIQIIYWAHTKNENVNKCTRVLVMNIKKRKQKNERKNQIKRNMCTFGFHFSRGGECFWAAYLNIISNHLWVKGRQKVLSLHLAFVYLSDAKHTWDKWRCDIIALTKNRIHSKKEWKANETKQQSQSIILDIVKRRRRRRWQRRRKNCLLFGCFFSHCSFATSHP